MSDQIKNRFLIVDDDQLNRILLRTFMENDGHEVMEAENGQVALEILKQETFDVILLDLVMPILTGIELLKLIQEDEEWKHIPVIIISAIDEVDRVVECLEMGATDVLTKPFNPSFLQARVKGALRAKQLRDIERAYLVQLESQNEELAAFSSTVAHDLKTPLSPILGMAELLKKYLGESADDKVLLMLDSIIKNSNRMADIISALLLLARVRNKQPDLVAVAMGDVVEDILDRLAHVQKEFAGEVILPDEWETAVGYGPWISEIWANYISNAFKYGGQPPEVRLGSDLLPNGQVQFWVKDNGDGIPQEELAKLFTPFTRLAQDRAEGHGLGLSIVERITKKLNGSVGAESELGVGSKFWFTLPANK